MLIAEQIISFKCASGINSNIADMHFVKMIKLQQNVARYERLLLCLPIAQL